MRACLPLLAALLCPTASLAAPPEELPAEAEAEAESEDPDLAAAEAIYQRGVTDYTAGRYEEAIETWLEAYNALPPNYETAKIRAELIYNIATAQKRAFDIDEDLSHLRQARASLQNFAESIDEAYPEGPARDRERAQVERVLAELEGQIAEVESARAAKERELAALSRPDFDPELDASLAKQNRGIIIGGAVLTSLGAAGLGTMGAGMALGSKAEREVGELATGAQLEARRDAIQKGKLGNGLLVVGAVVGGVATLAGVTMLGLGLSREKKRKAYRDQNARRIDVVPGFGPAGAGLELRGRF